MDIKPLPPAIWTFPVAAAGVKVIVSDKTKTLVRVPAISLAICMSASGFAAVTSVTITEIVP